VVVFTLPLKKEKEGWRLLHPYSIAKQTFISVIISLIAVVVFAAILQVVFVKRAGLDLEHLAEPVWLLNGMEAGLGSNPFGMEQEERSVIEEMAAQQRRHPDIGSGDARREDIEREEEGQGDKNEL
jgi:hypothetical protein